MNLKDCDKDVVIDMVNRREHLKGIKPFTITVTEPEEAEYLFGMAMNAASNGNDDVRDIMSNILALLTKKHGEEEGIKMFLDQAKENDYHFPKWFGPVYLLLVSTVKENADKQTKDKQ